MENKEDDIEDLFRERFANDEAPVSPTMWQNIRKTLPEEKNASGFSLTQNNVLWTVTGLLIIALMGSYTYFNLYKPLLPNHTKHAEERHFLSIKKYNTSIQTDSSYLLNSRRSVYSDSTSDRSAYDRLMFSPAYGRYTGKSDSQTDLLFPDKSFPTDVDGAGSTIDRENKTKRDHPNLTLIEHINLTIADRLNKSQLAAHRKGKQKTEKRVSDTVKKLKQNENQIVQLKGDKHAMHMPDAVSLSQHLSDSWAFKTDRQLASTDADSTLTEKHLHADKPDKSFRLPDVDSKNDNLTLNDHRTLPSGSSVDSLKERDSLLHQEGNRIDTSTPLRNDSLSNQVPIASGIRADSLSVPLDSVAITAKDSIPEKTNGEKEKIKLLQRISIDLIAGSLLTAASTKATDSTYQSAVEEKNNGDKTGLGYSAGLMLNYKVTRRMNVATGIMYSVFSEQFAFHYTVKKYDWGYVDSSWQQIESDSINRNIQAKNQYSFLCIPLQVSYAFIAKEKLRLSLTAGIRTNVLLKGVTYLPNSGKTDVVQQSGFSPVSFSYLLALEAEYKLGLHTALLFQPVFTYAATSVHSKSSALSQKPYGVGLTLGLRFTL